MSFHPEDPESVKARLRQLHAEARTVDGRRQDGSRGGPAADPTARGSSRAAAFRSLLTGDGWGRGHTGGAHRIDSRVSTSRADGGAASGFKRRRAEETGTDAPRGGMRNPLARDSGNPLRRIESSAAAAGPRDRRQPRFGRPRGTDDADDAGRASKPAAPLAELAADDGAHHDPVTPGNGSGAVAPADAHSADAPASEVDGASCTPASEQHADAAAAVAEPAHPQTTEEAGDKPEPAASTATGAGDAGLQQRGKRLFGALLGHLSKAKSQLESAGDRRIAAAQSTRQSAAAAREAERLTQERAAAAAEAAAQRDAATAKRERLLCEEAKAEAALSISYCERHAGALDAAAGLFLRTEAQPPLFWRPAERDSAFSADLRRQQRRVEEEAARRRAREAEWQASADAAAEAAVKEGQAAREAARRRRAELAVGSGGDSACSAAAELPPASASSAAGHVSSGAALRTGSARLQPQPARSEAADAGAGSGSRLGTMSAGEGSGPAADRVPIHSRSKAAAAPIISKGRQLRAAAAGGPSQQTPASAGAGSTPAAADAAGPSEQDDALQHDAAAHGSPRASSLAAPRSGSSAQGSAGGAAARETAEEVAEAAEDAAAERPAAKRQRVGSDASIGAGEAAAEPRPDVAVPSTDASSPAAAVAAAGTLPAPTEPVEAAAAGGGGQSSATAGGEDAFLDYGE